MYRYAILGRLHGKADILHMTCRMGSGAEPQRGLGQRPRRGLGRQPQWGAGRSPAKKILDIGAAFWQPKIAQNELKSENLFKGHS